MTPPTGPIACKAAACRAVRSTTSGRRSNSRHGSVWTRSCIIRRPASMTSRRWRTRSRSPGHRCATTALPPRWARTTAPSAPGCQPAVRWPPTSAIIHDLDRQRAQAGDLRLEYVADLQPGAGAETDTFRSARHDHVTGFERDVLADARDLFGHVPDHARGAGVLPQFAVDPEPELEIVLVHEAGGNDAGSERAAVVEGLAAEQVELGHMLRVPLPVAGGHVETDRVARDVAHRLIDVDLAASPPDDDGELEFVVEFRRLCRVAD